jgi:hypothetical protein
VEEDLVIKLLVDSLFAVHPEMQSHTRATMTLGKGAVHSILMKQKINTESLLMEAELVGVDDAMPLVMWTQNFLEAQGYNIQDNVVYRARQPECYPVGEEWSCIKWKMHSTHI